MSKKYYAATVINVIIFDTAVFLIHMTVMLLRLLFEISSEIDDSVIIVIIVIVIKNSQVVDTHQFIYYFDRPK